MLPTLCNGEIIIMSVYGLKLLDSHSRMTLDSTHYVARLRWTKYVAASGSGSEVVSGIAGRKPFPCCVPLSDGLSPDVVISGDTVTWTQRSWADEGSVASIIYIFLLN